MEKHLNKALFLDRDGVINEDYDYVYQIQNFHFKPGIFELCQYANSKGYLIFIITNQAGIARGFYSERDFVKLTRWMLAEFQKHNCLISKVYYCPYHPEYGNSKYKRTSSYRKPGPGMILKAQKRFHVDLVHSVLIGDQTTDLQAGLKAGIGTNLLVFNPNKKSSSLLEGTFLINSLDDAISYLT
ncbi:D-glycero-alpha-D-manno-heptose-1,7-bisphosphate 7-phosphatase [Leptospira bouyouniensis]|uniref:D-glycero-alpha-D-manno-heptose-1,7-bisphosphate 7-phosphatase n=1 Tax=Leptospira bouyouniensis TaxID=2484911 RepID=UPI001090BFBE|nr:HAD family hydrolase [Leptospira bouyouniensis]TGM80975.1 HAD family hydrolase [Leptospira bouyouniensis]